VISDFNRNCAMSLAKYVLLSKLRRLRSRSPRDLVMVSADADFGEMLGFAGTIFGQTPGSCRATLGRHGLPAVARERVG
jgi:hypothetical protein